MADKMKRYLGDGVYADVDKAGRVLVTTENGISITNSIYLEPEVGAELIEYLQQVYAGYPGWKVDAGVRE